VFLITTYPSTAGALLNVFAGDNLQATLNSAQPGDTIVLQAGAVFSGNFILPAKNGSDWIIIRTSNLEGISTEGTRVSATQAGAMPRIVTPNSAPALATAPGAHNYRLVGLELGIAAGVGTNYGIVCLGDGNQSSLSLTPRDLVIDRCYIHGNSTGDVSRGVALNSASSAVIDSNISACHGVGFDTQAIAGWNGPGPFKIVNNFLEAAGENLMFGGADPRVPDLVPSDVEFRRNYCAKPVSWNPADPEYAGIHWSVKNIFELKNAQRVLVDGNVFEHCWVDGQTGFIVVFTPRNQEGTAPWSVVQDVTFTNNLSRHAAAGIQFLGQDNNYPSQREQRIKVENNLFYDIGGPLWGGNGRLFQIVDGTANVHINHNTGIQTGNIVTADEAPSTGFVFTNNITPQNDYGVMGSGHGIGNDSLNYYFPGCIFSRNVIIGGPASAYPTGNFFPPSIDDVLFVDSSNGNYRLMSGSPYKNGGTDGRDIGADQDAILAAIGNEPPSNQPPHVSITASTTSGAAPLNIDFTANASDSGGTIISYNWDFGDGQTSSLSSVSHSYHSSGMFNARVTVTDNLGASAAASIGISVTSPPLPPGSEVVLHTARLATLGGRWSPTPDSTAASSGCLWNPDAGAPKLTTPLAQPVDYFEMSFYALAGLPYRLWIRGKAENDSPYNDSVFVQFSQSVDASGVPVFRIGTTDATTVNLEDCFGCGLHGWGWQDNGWGIGVMGPLIYFSATGPETIRVQVREDGLRIDQIVLSPQLYLNASPGALKDDVRILPESSGLWVSTISTVLPLSGPTAGGTRIVINGDGFAPGATVAIGGVTATSIQVESPTTITAVTPQHTAGAVAVVVTNIDGRASALLDGYTYFASPIQVSISASATSGMAPVKIRLRANVIAPDRSIASYQWDFGDGKTATHAEVSHTYKVPGKFDARVIVTDNRGSTATASVEITVAAPISP
jgi:PKD repeat protein